MANSSIVGLLKVLLTADSAQFDAEMKRVSSSAQTWSKDLATMGRQATTLGANLTKTLTLPLVGLAAASIKAGMDFESSFANVAKTVDGVSDSAGTLTERGQELAMTFRQMAKEIPVTTDELTAIAALGGQMGVPIEQLATFTRHVAALGVAVDGISTEDAAAGLAQIGNIAGTGTTQIAEMASALVHLGNSSNATESDILEFTKRLMGAGSAVGMSIAEVMALGTAMANVGINAEAGGTAMSQMIAKMSMAISTGGESLKAFDALVASTGETFATIWKRSPVEAIDAVVKGLGHAKASGHDLNLVVREIGATNVRTADTMKRLAGAGDGVSASIVIANEGFQSANKHLEEFDKKAATTKNQLKILWSQIYDVGITIFDTLKPGIATAISLAQSLTPHLDKLAAGFAQLPGGIQLSVFAIAGLAAAAGPAIFVFGKLALLAADMTALFGKTGLATRALTGIIGLMGGQSPVVAGLGRALTLVTGPIGWLIGAATGILSLTGTWDELFRILKAGAQIVGGIVIVVFDEFMTILKGFIEASFLIVKTISHYTGLTFVLQKVGDALGWLGRKFADFMGWLANTAEAGASAVNAINPMIAPVEQLGAAVGGLAVPLEAAQAGLKGTAKETVNLTGLLGDNEAATKANEKAKKAQAAAEREAEQATKALSEQLARQRDILRDLGIVTQSDVVNGMLRFGDAMLVAQANGVPLVNVLKAAIPKLQELEKQARASGVDTAVLSARIRELNAELTALLGGIPTLNTVAFDPKKVLAGFKTINLATVKAASDAERLKDAYRLLGVDMQADLDKAATDAALAFELIRSSGTATPAEIQEAFDRMTEAQRAAARKVPGYWSEVFTHITGMARAWKASFASALLGMRGQSATEHQRLAEDAKENYDDVQVSAKETYEDIEKRARETYAETVRRAQDALDRVMRDEAASNDDRAQAQAIFNQARADAEDVMNKDIAAAHATMTTDISTAYQEMLDAEEAASHTFKDNLKDIWKQIKLDFLDVLVQMLADFEHAFIKGLIGLATGNRGALVDAFGGLLGLGAKAGAGAVIPGATSVGTLTAPGAGAGTGVGLGALGTTLGAIGLGGAIGFGIWKAFFDNPHRPWDALTGQEEAGKFFDSMGGEENFRAFLESLGFAADEIEGLVDPLKDEVVLGIRSSFDAAIEAIRDAIRGKGIDITGGDFQVPHLASGGIVRQPTLAMIGEAGPEAVVPLNGQSFGGTTVVQVIRPDGRVEAEYMWPFLAGHVRKIQLGHS